MSNRLVVESGEVKDVGVGKTEQHQGATVKGTLDVQGNLELVDEPESADVGPGASTIDLPLSVNIFSMEQGTALFLTLTMGTLLGGIALVRAWAAGILWAMALFTLIVSGLLGIGLEIFWSMVAGSLLLLIAGMAVRWSR